MSRIQPFAERDGQRTWNPKSYESFQWLAERLLERRQGRPAVPAYVNGPAVLVADFANVSTNRRRHY